MKILKKILILILIIIVAIGSVFGVKGYNMYKEAITKQSIEGMVNEIRSKEHYTKIEDLPQTYLDAVVAVEDRRFYRHCGIDLISIGRAIFNDIRSMKLVEGGSTITQQLAKNTSYFGDGYYCVKDAANGYFDKDPKDMNSYESTLLAGIPNAPSVYAPTKNPDLARQRQMQVINKMIKYKYLTQEEANNISEENGEYWPITE